MGTDPATRDHRPVRELIDLTEAVACGRPVPAAAGKWWAEGVARWMEGREPLERCLGLAPAPGCRDVRTRLATLERNRHLREAWEVVTAEAVSPWRRSQLLATELRAFECRVWPRFRDSDDEPTSALRRALCRAYRAQQRITPDGASHRDLGWCAGMPLTARALHEIVKGAGGSHFTGGA